MVSFVLLPKLRARLYISFILKPTRTDTGKMYLNSKILIAIMPYK